MRHIVRRGAAGIGLPFQRLDLVRSAPDSAPAVRGAADDHIGWSGGYQQWFGSGTDCGCGKDHALQVLDVIWDEEGREGIDGGKLICSAAVKSLSRQLAWLGIEAGGV